MSSTQTDNTKLDPAIVDTIVRRVMERLSELNTNSSQLNAPNQAQTNTSESTVLELDQKVVTLESIRGRLDGVRTLVVEARSVVTPAVFDELNERGIQLDSRRNGKSNDSVSEQFCLARLSSHFVPADWLKAEGLGTICCGGNFSEIGEKLERSHAQGKTVCFAAQPFVAAATLNRNQGLRAAYARTEKEVNEVNSTLNANVLVLDAVQPRPELLKLIRVFVTFRSAPGRQQCDQKGSGEEKQ